MRIKKRKKLLKRLNKLTLELAEIRQMVYDSELDKYDLLIMNICKALKTSYADLQSKRHHRHLVYRRYVVIRILSNLGLRPTDIARKLFKDHSTVLAGNKRYDELYGTYDDFTELADLAHKTVQKYESKKIISDIA